MRLIYTLGMLAVAMVLGWDLHSTVIAFAPDPAKGRCERGRIGEQLLQQVQAFYPETMTGDFIIASGCWRAVEVFQPSSALGQPAQGETK